MASDNHIGGAQAGDGPGCEVADGGWTSPAIERLVTGELDDGERLELLAWLDAEPARWRRCGLAFLEAQALREVLACKSKGEPEPSGCAISQVHRTPFHWLRPWRGMLAAAAAAVTAFVLGWALGHWPATGGDAGIVAAGSSTTESSESTESAAASQVALTQERLKGPSGPDPFPNFGGSVALVRMRVGQEPNAREVIMPVLAKTAGDTSWECAGGPIPEYVRRQWERQGYRVTERRQTVLLKLSDGRQIDVPVEHVLLTFVGQPLL